MTWRPKNGPLALLIAIVFVAWCAIAAVVTIGWAMAGGTP
jgi:hypothetical protein